MSPLSHSFFFHSSENLLHLLNSTGISVFCSEETSQERVCPDDGLGSASGACRHWVSTQIADLEQNLAFSKIC